LLFSLLIFAVIKYGFNSIHSYLWTWKIRKKISFYLNTRDILIRITFLSDKFFLYQSI
jgi:hypothetical protein